jgi:hypothetical protein
VNYPPALFARYLVEAATAFGGKKKLATAMRNPSIALKSKNVIVEKYRHSENIRPSQQHTTRLSVEVIQAIDADPMNSPKQDKQRHTIGVEYEVILEHFLNKMSKHNATLFLLCCSRRSLHSLVFDICRNPF